MHDMTRDELQDRLPELLHGRLSAAEAAALERAVSADPALAEELAVLRRVHAAHRASPVMDVSRIVAALPAAPVAQVAPVLDDLALRRAAKQQPAISRRFARAAAVLVVVGGGTMVSVWGRGAVTPTPALPAVHAESVAVGAPALQLGLGASTDELSVEQLRALEADIKSLDGVPSADPESAAELLPAEGA